MLKFYEILNCNALRPFRFLIVGGIATATHMLVAVTLFAVYHDLSLYVVNLIAFLVAFLASFYGHKHVTFQTQGSMRRFLLVAIAGFLANNMLLAGCIAIGFGDLIAVIIATASVPLLTYFASSLWAFNINGN